jgi:hypothetical protein
MANRYLQKLATLEQEHHKVLEKLANDHNNKSKQDEKKYLDLQEAYSQQQKEGFETLTLVAKQNTVEL